MSYNFDYSKLLDLLKKFRYEYYFQYRNNHKFKKIQRFYLASELNQSYASFISNNKIPEKIKLSNFIYSRNMLINFFSDFGFKIISYKREYGKTEIIIRPL